jgi:insulysin
MKSDFFEALRTKQQTAYITKAWEKEEENQLLQLFAVQSSTHQPSDLIARFELFLENFIKQYTTILPEERFENIRVMAIQSLEMLPENLELASRRLFALGFDYAGDFNLISKRIKALQELTYDQTRRDAVDYFSRLNTRRLAVLVEGASQKDREFRYELISKQELTASGTFVTKSNETLADEAQMQQR